MKKSHSELGFTLVELLVAAVIGLATTMVGGKVMLDQLESTRKIENQQRQRDDWTRSNTFITSEINLAEEVSKTLRAGENNHCKSNEPDAVNPVNDNNAKMIIRFPREQQLKPAIYYTVQTEAGWNNNILKRCGPSIDKNGRYLKSVSTGDVIIDGLSDLQTGFNVEVTGQKLAKVEINLVGLLNNAYQQEDGSRARVQTVYLYPETSSFCIGERTTQAGVIKSFSGNKDTYNDTSTNWATEMAGNVLICGRGGGDEITSGTGHDQLEAGDPGASTLKGGDGNDRLLGSNSNDHLYGQSGNDTIIGRQGNDTLEGGAGTNQYVSGIDDTQSYCDRDTIKGTENGYDIIHFKQNKANYTIACSTSKCRVTLNNSDTDQKKAVDITSGDLLIFADDRVELPVGNTVSLGDLNKAKCSPTITSPPADNNSDDCQSDDSGADESSSDDNQPLSLEAVRNALIENVVRHNLFQGGQRKNNNDNWTSFLAAIEEASLAVTSEGGPLAGGCVHVKSGGQNGGENGGVYLVHSADPDRNNGNRTCASGPFNVIEFNPETGQLLAESRRESAP